MLFITTLSDFCELSSKVWSCRFPATSRNLLIFLWSSSDYLSIWGYVSSSGIYNFPLVWCLSYAYPLSTGNNVTRVGILWLSKQTNVRVAPAGTNIRNKIINRTTHSAHILKLLNNLLICMGVTWKRSGRVAEWVSVLSIRMSPLCLFSFHTRRRFFHRCIAMNAKLVHSRGASLVQNVPAWKWLLLIWCRRRRKLVVWY